MSTFSSSLIPSQIKKIISLKPYLLTPSELSEAGSDINLVGVDPFNNLVTDQNKSFSPKLLNWVEPYTIGGVRYTLFYTEVNHGLSVGNRVFIINGNYDSDLLIKSDKYKKGRDGYKVLFVDKCQVVLDIEYNGTLPVESQSVDDFINLFYIKNEGDFKHANRHITTKGGSFDYKFNYYKNNIIYVDQDYTGFAGWGENGGLTGSPGFYVRNGTYSWTNITSEFITGSFSYALTPGSISSRVKVNNGSFTFSIGPGFVEFEETSIYKFDMALEPDANAGTYSTWITDVRYEKPFITKGNFRGGNFKGNWNTGLFGRSDKKVIWEGDTSAFNSGTVLNAIWNKGKIDSLYTLSESYSTEFDQFGIPNQKSIGVNNNGKGYNFIVDSDILSSTIVNGTVINSTIGQSSTYSVVDNFITSNNINLENDIIKATFEDCQFNNSNVSNAEIKNARALNTYFDNVKLINSKIKNSVVKNSNYLSDDIIKILDYDEFNYAEVSSIDAPSHKVYKFYISKKDYERLKIRDRFYLKGLNYNTNLTSPLTIFDNRFRLSTWTDYRDQFNENNLIPWAPTYSFYKRGIEVGTFLSTPEDNSYIYNSITSGVSSLGTSVISTNSKKNYSLDIVISLFDKDSLSVSGLNFNRDVNQSFTYSLTMSTHIGNIIDVSNAYILDSDFESGLVENTNWLAGYHINYNNDVNITTDSSVGKYYNLSVVTSSSTLIATTTYDSNFPESGEDCLAVGNIVFLNAVDYDTLGQITSFTVSFTGSDYADTTGATTSGGSGTGATFDITTDTTGEILALLLTASGSGAFYTPNYATSSEPLIGGSGSSATVAYTVDGSGYVISATISNGGLDYIIGNTFSLGSGDAIVEVTEVTVSEIIAATISNVGLGYQVGDILTVQGGNSDSFITILGVTGSLTRLPDTYRITQNLGSQLYLQEVFATGSGVISSLLDGGLYYTKDSQNRYGYIYKAKISKSKIYNGVFKRSYITESLIENLDFDIIDKDLTNLSNTKSLLIYESLFSNNSNILSKALYMNSIFINGSDNFNNGIVSNSIWIGPTFSNGVFRSGRWVDGNFLRGTFYNSKSFNKTTTVNNQYYDVENQRFYLKDGQTSDIIFNNRLSWQNGTFSNGEFYKSDWEKGNFKNGKFYFSNFYNGRIDNGEIGDISLSFDKTNILGASISYAVVENANLFAEDVSYNGLSGSSIDWYNGIFENGVFGCDLDYVNDFRATWHDGVFNGGEFKNLAKWKTGIFNGGKFTSAYGWTYSPTYTTISTDVLNYSWEDGVFNGGEFGTAETATNSVWFTGEFNGGVFKGRVWNDGLFTQGEFNGSATISSVGGASNSNAVSFTDSFSQSFYGLWMGGIVTNIADKFKKDEKIFTTLESPKKNIIRQPMSYIKNTLWISGTFSHQRATMENCVWLDGAFERGYFNNGSFNPFVVRPGDTSKSFNTNDDTCYWENGHLKESEFNYSNWYQGKFIMGTANGMIFKDGVVDYMNAFNIFWENGLWRNGNWYGSYIEYSGSLTDTFSINILNRGLSWSGNNELHVWNIFEDTTENQALIENATASTIQQYILPTKF